MSKEDFDEVCRGLRAEDTADFLVRLEDSELKERIISALKDRELKEVMDEISVDDTLEIIEEMPTDVIRRIAEEDEILKLLEERNFVVLKPLLKEFNPTDLAAVLDEVPKERRRAYFPPSSQRACRGNLCGNEQRQQAGAYTLA